MTPTEAADAFVAAVLAGEPEDAKRAKRLGEFYRRMEDRLLGHLEMDDEEIARRLSAWRAANGY